MNALFVAPTNKEAQTIRISNATNARPMYREYIPKLLLALYILSSRCLEIYGLTGMHKINAATHIQKLSESALCTSIGNPFEGPKPKKA